MPPLTDPDRLAAYRDALGKENWAVEGYVRFELNEQAQRWIERMMYEFVAAGGEIDEVQENRDGWKDLHEFHYDLRFTIRGIAVYIETRLIYRPPFKPGEPEILVVNIHDQ